MKVIIKLKTALALVKLLSQSNNQDRVYENLGEEISEAIIESADDQLKPYNKSSSYVPEGATEIQKQHAQLMEDLKLIPDDIYNPINGYIRNLETLMWRLQTFDITVDKHKIKDHMIKIKKFLEERGIKP